MDELEICRGSVLCAHKYIHTYIEIEIEIEIGIERERVKGTDEFTNNALVNKDGNGDAEDANKGEVAASPAEIVLQILSSSAPILYEFVLVCFHSSSHLSLSSLSLLFLFSSDPIPLLFFLLPFSPLPHLPRFTSMGLGPLPSSFISAKFSLHHINSNIYPINY